MVNLILEFHSISFRFVQSCSVLFRLVPPVNNTSQFLETDVIQGLAVCTRHCCDSYTCSKVTKISDQDRSFLSNVSNLLDLPALSQGRRLSVHR